LIPAIAGVFFVPVVLSVAGLPAIAGTTDVVGLMLLLFVAGVILVSLF
jgi:hypothetical protein